MDVYESCLVGAAVCLAVLTWSAVDFLDGLGAMRREAHRAWMDQFSATRAVPSGAGKGWPVFSKGWLAGFLSRAAEGATDAVCEWSDAPQEELIARVAEAIREAFEAAGAAGTAHGRGAFARAV